MVKPKIELDENRIELQWLESNDWTWSHIGVILESYWNHMLTVMLGCMIQATNDYWLIKIIESYWKEFLIMSMLRVRIMCIENALRDVEQTESAGVLLEKLCLKRFNRRSSVESRSKRFGSKSISDRSPTGECGACLANWSRMTGLQLFQPLHTLLAMIIKPTLKLVFEHDCWTSRLTKVNTLY